MQATMSKKDRKLSETMREIIRDLRDGEDRRGYRGCEQTTDLTGWSRSSLEALRKRGLIDWWGSERVILTDAGREAAEK